MLFFIQQNIVLADVAGQILFYMNLQIFPKKDSFKPEYDGDQNPGHDLLNNMSICVKTE